MMIRNPFAIRPAARAAILVGALLPQLAGPSIALAADDPWMPGKYLKESMVRLLATASVIAEQSEYGFLETAYLGALLRPGSFSFLTMTLDEGTKYAFIGAGNEPTRDLDIIIEDEDGKSVAADVKDDATPIVKFTPARTGRYSIKLKLQEATGPCFCGVVLMREKGWNVPTKNLDAAMDNMLAACVGVAKQKPARFLEVPGEWAVIGTILKQGDSNTFSDIRLGEGRRVMISGGDTVSRDIDLAVFEQADPIKILNKDEDDDARPLVQCKASDDRRYGLIIKNSKSDGGTMIMTAILDVEG